MEIKQNHIFVLKRNVDNYVWVHKIVKVNFTKREATVRLLWSNGGLRVCEELTVTYQHLKDLKDENWDVIDIFEHQLPMIKVLYGPIHKASG